MEPFAKSMTGFPSSILFAIIATTSLFAVLPLLTQLQGRAVPRPAVEPVLIDTQRPAPPPSENRDDPERQSLPEKTIVEQKDRPRQVQPKIDIPRGGLGSIGVVGIDIGLPEFHAEIPPVSDPTYTPGEVDQAPRLLRSFPPQYPYLAKRDNIEGWVMLRFVVDTEGAPGKIEVAAADPAGIFEEAALKAVSRYTFKPALKDGETVNCIVQQRIHFSLD